MFIIALQVLYITFLLNAHVTVLLLTVFHINYYMCYNIAWWTSKTERMVGRTRGSVRIAPPWRRNKAFSIFNNRETKLLFSTDKGHYNPAWSLNVHLGLLFSTTCDLLSLWKGDRTFSAFNPAAFVRWSHYSHYCTFSEQFVLLSVWLQALILTRFFWDNTATIFPLPSVTPSTCKGHGLQISSVNFLSLVSQLLEACWLPTYLQLSNLLEK